MVTVLTPPAQFNYTGEWPEVINLCKQNNITKFALIRTTISLVINNSRTWNKDHMIA